MARLSNGQLVFIIPAVLMLVATSVYALTLAHLYRSETRILIKPKTVLDERLSAAEARERFDEQIGEMQVMLASRTYMMRIIEQYQLFGFGSGSNFRIEDAVNSLRNNIRLDISGNNTFVLSFRHPNPQSARDITKKLADSIIMASFAARKNAVIERDQFIDEQLRRTERDLMKMEVPDPSKRQQMSRDYALAQKHYEELVDMKFHSEMGAARVTDINSELYQIVDEASLPDRPETPSKLLVMLAGMGMAFAVALPTAWMGRKPLP